MRPCATLKARATDVGICAASLCAVAAALTVLNGDVQRFVVGVLGRASLAELAWASGGSVRVLEAITSTVAFYAADHVMLAFFGAGALVLLGLMLRT